MESSWASKIDPGSPGWPQDPPKSEPNLDPINRNFEAQVGLHFGGGLGGHVAPQSTFLEGQVGPLVGGPSWVMIYFEYCFY